MTRSNSDELVDAIKEARTPEEMVRTWLAQTSGVDTEAAVARLKLWIQRRPDIIERAYKLYTDIVERGLLDQKTRELCFLAMALQEAKPDSVVEYCQKAKAAGATDEEIMEVAAVICYGAGKRSGVNTSIMMTEAFKRAANVTSSSP